MIGYCNEEADALIRQADAETDPERRLAPYEEAGRLIGADTPVVFRSHAIAIALVKLYVAGYVATSRDFWTGISLLRTIDLTQETVPASAATPAA
jgi:ABC-type transport system substrate-binding protein